MKKITENFKTILFVFVLLFSKTLIFANEINPSVKIINAESKIFALILNDAKLTDVTIRILDLAGVTLLEEEITVNNKFSKSYDLSKLPRGTYEVELEDEFFYQKQLLKITSNGLEILNNEEDKIFKPTVLLKGETILLNMLVLGKENVEITILDQNREELFSEKIENTKTIHRSYNLSKLESGNYIVSVRIKGKVFRNTVYLKK